MSASVAFPACRAFYPGQAIVSSLRGPGRSTRFDGRAALPRPAGEGGARGRRRAWGWTGARLGLPQGPTTGPTHHRGAAVPDIRLPTDSIRFHQVRTKGLGRPKFSAHLVWDTARTTPSLSPPRPDLFRTRNACAIPRGPRPVGESMWRRTGPGPAGETAAGAGGVPGARRAWGQSRGPAAVRL